MATRSCGNGTNFDWLRESCDISTCDLSPNGNPEKYEWSMKLAILAILPPWIWYTILITSSDKGYCINILAFVKGYGILSFKGMFTSLSNLNGYGTLACLLQGILDTPAPWY